MQPVQVDGGALTREQVVAVARGRATVTLGETALDEVTKSRAHIEQLADADTPTYGVSTGFGALATRHIPPDRRAALQRSLIRSHAAGAGQPVEPEVVRALMLLRLRTLATGRTGVRPVTVETLTKILNAGIVPVVHEYGSLGCSGDLAPLSAVALALMGEGDVLEDGETRGAADALRASGIEPVVLAEKEGLALINGTDGMLGMLVMALTDLSVLMRTADIAAAMSVEGQLGTDRVFAPELQAIRPHPGQALSAANLTAILKDSGVVASHRGPDCNRV
ncbi:aromatic amino acid lyase, partial [Actinophytocola sp.]|uniref:aromatic amino acid lyase n=1 Tax=Actinophytocola sp. TaxID=1872138 RepID=UPI002EDA4587